MDVSIRLSTAVERSTVGAPLVNLPVTLFDVVVTWEYALTPSTRIQRFASTNDLGEFHDFLSDVPATSTWYIAPESGADAREPAAFEVLSYSVDGEELPIRRTLRKTGQTYTIDLGAEILLKEQPVRIRHVYRTVSRRPGTASVSLSPSRPMDCGFCWTTQPPTSPNCVSATWYPVPLHPKSSSCPRKRQPSKSR